MNNYYEIKGNTIEFITSEFLSEKIKEEAALHYGEGSKLVKDIQVDFNNSPIIVTKIIFEFDFSLKSWETNFLKESYVYTLLKKELSVNSKMEKREYDAWKQILLSPELKRHGLLLYLLETVNRMESIISKLPEEKKKANWLAMWRCVEIVLSEVLLTDRNEQFNILLKEVHSIIIEMENK